MSIPTLFTYTVPKDFANKSIEAFLLEQGYTKSLLSALKRVRFFEEEIEHYGIEKMVNGPLP